MTESNSPRTMRPDTTASERAQACRRLNPSQRATVNRLIRYYRGRVAYNGVTSVRLDIKHHDSFVSVYVQTWRSDCHRYSPAGRFESVDVRLYRTPRRPQGQAIEFDAWQRQRAAHSKDVPL